MQVLYTLDAQNYDISLSHFVREAVRAIIVMNGKIVLVRSDKYGEYKFPGGGVEAGESHADTVIRETKEEAGLIVVPSSIREYGMIRELRLGIHGDEIFEQNSYYYLCDVENGIFETNLDEYEEQYGYKLAIVSIDEAIGANAQLVNHDGTVWAKRELLMLRHIKENLFL